MSYGGVQQRPRQLRADRVMHLHPAVVDQRAGRRGKPQQPGGRSAEQSRAGAQHADATIDLDSEPVRQPRLGHRSIPSSPGAQRRIQVAQASTISVNRRAPASAVAVVGSPSTPTSLTAATPPRRMVDINSASGATLPVRRSSMRTVCGERCSSIEVSVWPACASPPGTEQGHHAGVAPFVPEAPHRRHQRVDVSAVAVDEHDPWCPFARRAAELHQHRLESGGSDRHGPGEGLMLAAGPVGDRGRNQWRGSGRECGDDGVRDCGRRCGCRCPVADGARAARWSPLEPPRLATHLRPASTSTSLTPSGRPRGDRRPNSSGIHEVFADE